MKWDRESPYLFLEDWRRNDVEMEFEECLGQFQLRKKWEDSKEACYIYHKYIYHKHNMVEAWNSITDPKLLEDQ